MREMLQFGGDEGRKMLEITRRGIAEFVINKPNSIKYIQLDNKKKLNQMLKELGEVYEEGLETLNYLPTTGLLDEIIDLVILIDKEPFFIKWEKTLFRLLILYGLWEKESNIDFLTNFVKLSPDDMTKLMVYTEDAMSPLPSFKYFELRDMKNGENCKFREVFKKIDDFLETSLTSKDVIVAINNLTKYKYASVGEKVAIISNEKNSNIIKDLFERTLVDREEIPEEIFSAFLQNTSTTKEVYDKVVDIRGELEIEGKEIKNKKKNLINKLVSKCFNIILFFGLICCFIVLVSLLGILEGFVAFLVISYCLISFSIWKRGSL